MKKSANKTAEVVETLGAGVVKAEVEKIKKETPPKEPEFKKDSNGNTIWKDKPCLRDQLTLYPQTTRLGALVCQVFNLSCVADLEEYNKLLEGAHPVSAPALQLSERVEFSRDGCFIVMCKTRKVQYKQLVPLMVDKKETD